MLLGVDTYLIQIECGISAAMVYMRFVNAKHINCINARRPLLAQRNVALLVILDFFRSYFKGNKTKFLIPKTIHTSSVEDTWRFKKEF